jgi:hypothetical protein
MVDAVSITHSVVPQGVPTAEVLVSGALAVNLVDRALYSKTYTGAIIRIEGDSGNDTLASAATLALGAVMAAMVDVSGTTTITAIELEVGQTRTVRFTGILTLTHGALLVLPGGANISTAVGDFAVFRGYGDGVVRCTNYSFASGFDSELALPLATTIHVADSKETPVDADELPIVDSAASNILKKLTWANFKATLATWLNGGNIGAWFTTLKATGVVTVKGTGNLIEIRNGANVRTGYIQEASGHLAIVGEVEGSTIQIYANNTLIATVSSTGVAVTGAVSGTGLISGATIKPTAIGGYVSSDGSAGFTGTVTAASLSGKTITFKDGIITNFS